MRATRTALAALAVAAATGQTTDYCDAEYECEYRTTDWTRNLYDLKPLCTGAKPYVSPPSATGWSIQFQICGTANVDCVPSGYKVTYNRGSAVQFIDNNVPPGNCTNNAGVAVPCTPNCEVIGVGVPIFTVRDPANPSQGVNVSYYSVPDQAKDGFLCPVDPVTKGPLDRKVQLTITCDPTADPPVIGQPYEDPGRPCLYYVPIRSKYGCGCAPSCTGNCGLSNCGTYCSPAGLAGGCPGSQKCLADRYGTNYCCARDCRGRQCGSDGCGGLCGICLSGSECTSNQQCARINPLPSPAPPVQVVTKYTTTGADVFASFVGGVLAAGVGSLGFSYFRRVREALQEPLLAGGGGSTVAV